MSCAPRGARDEVATDDRVSVRIFMSVIVAVLAFPSAGAEPVKEAARPSATQEQVAVHLLQIGHASP